MKQALMTKPAEIIIRDVAKPAPGAGEVLLRVSRIGVCGSDIHVYHGLHPTTPYPVVQGHEVSGVVAELGSGVTRFKAGDPVTFMPQVTCGECYPCRHGMYHICDNLKVMGFQTGGAAQEYFAVPESMVIPLPAGLSLEAGAMIEPVSVAVHALGRIPSVQGQKVLIFGAGTIGNLVGQTAKAMGAAAVMICDLSDFRLSMAKKCGIDYAVNTRTQDIAAAIAKNFGPDKADVTLECVGVEPTMTAAIANARKGTSIVVVGVFGKKPPVDLGTVQDRELSLIGTLMYQKRDYEKAIELVSAGKMRLEQLVTNHFPFDRYLDAYHYIEEAGDKTLKVMIEVS
ncbi:MAG TPA: alcohol dehydrogenase catalytic domain-containing protein [Spirochaetia bacterium]|nr:alcohol dehydrogenase catalytic domain-containing protein [Spirochaetia bacterium]